MHFCVLLKSTRKLETFQHVVLNVLVFCEVFDTFTSPEPSCLQLFSSLILHMGRWGCWSLRLRNRVAEQLDGNRQGHFKHILSNSRNIVLFIGFHTLSSSRTEARAWAAVRSWQLPEPLLHDWEERLASPPEVALFSTGQHTRSNWEWKNIHKTPTHVM